MPTLVAQLGADLTGVQKVVKWIPAGSGNILLKFVQIDYEIFLAHLSHSDKDHILSVILRAFVRLCVRP